jgi:hypothetical protein
MVPMMRRQQHDEANKQLENQILELNKVSPLDKHYNEAQRIKSELTGTITSQAEKLATEGFNNNTTSSIFKTNRSVADMYSPTGALGQINAAKTAYEKDSDEYLKSATALGHSPEVVQQNLKAIQDEYNAAPVYDKSGKVTGMSINKLPPKYVDHVARFKDIADKAGLSSRDIENLSSRIAKTGDGGTYVLTESGKNASSSNVAALQAAVNFLNTEIMNPNSDVGKSLKYNFKSPEDALKDIQNLAPVFVKNNVASSSSSQISGYNPPSEPKDGKGSNPIELEGVNLGEGVLNESNTALAESMGILANGKITQFTKEERDKQSPFNAPLFKIGGKTEKSKVFNDPKYVNIANGLNRNLPKELKFKRNSTEEYNAVKKYLSENANVTIQNRYVDPNSSQVGMLFANRNLPKEKKAASLNLLGKIKLGASSVVDFNGNIIPASSIRSFEYNGDMTPESKVKAFKNNPKMNIIPHVGSVVDIEGNIIPVYVSRNTDDFKTPQYKGASDINLIKNQVTTSPSIYHHLNSDKISGFKNHGMKNVEIKFNRNSGTYDVSYHYNDGKNLIKEDHKLNDNQLNEWLIDLNN